jgi:hypothetical protein
MLNLLRPMMVKANGFSNSLKKYLQIIKNYSSASTTSSNNFSVPSTGSPPPSYSTEI